MRQQDGMHSPSEGELSEDKLSSTAELLQWLAAGGASGRIGVLLKAASTDGVRRDPAAAAEVTLTETEADTVSVMVDEGYVNVEQRPSGQEIVTPTQTGEELVDGLQSITNNGEDIAAFHRLIQNCGWNQYLVDGYSRLTEDYLMLETDVLYYYGLLVVGLESLTEVVVTINVPNQFEDQTPEMDDVEYIYTPRAKHKVLYDSPILQELAETHQSDGHVKYHQIDRTVDIPDDIEIEPPLTDLPLETFHKNTQHTSRYGQLPFNLGLMDINEETLKNLHNNTDILQDELDFDDEIVVIETIDTWATSDAPNDRVLWLSDTDGAREWAHETFNEIKSAASPLPWSRPDNLYATDF